MQNSIQSDKAEGNMKGILRSNNASYICLLGVQKAVTERKHETISKKKCEYNCLNVSIIVRGGPPQILISGKPL